mgnify:CR=1 FL=1
MLGSLSGLEKKIQENLIGMLSSQSVYSKKTTHFYDQDGKIQQQHQKRSNSRKPQYQHSDAKLIKRGQNLIENINIDKVRIKEEKVSEIDSNISQKLSTSSAESLILQDLTALNDKAKSTQKNREKLDLQPHSSEIASKRVEQSKVSAKKGGNSQRIAEKGGETTVESKGKLYHQNIELEKRKKMEQLENRKMEREEKE